MNNPFFFLIFQIVDLAIPTSLEISRSVHPAITSFSTLRSVALANFWVVSFRFSVNSIKDLIQEIHTVQKLSYSGTLFFSANLSNLTRSRYRSRTLWVPGMVQSPINWVKSLFAQ